MNISISNIESNGGDGLEDRPEYVDAALVADTKLGWREGRPIAPSDESETYKLGGDPSEHYSHYPSSEDLYLPQYGEFLSRLLDSDLVGSWQDAADEMRPSVSSRDVKKASDLHDLSEPRDDAVDVSADAEGKDTLGLPGGESVPVALCDDAIYSDKMVLAALLSMGMSVEEIYRYLDSQDVVGRLRETHVRSAARQHNLI